MIEQKPGKPWNRRFGSLVENGSLTIERAEFLFRATELALKVRDQERPSSFGNIFFISSRAEEVRVVLDLLKDWRGRGMKLFQIPDQKLPDPIIPGPLLVSKKPAEYQPIANFDSLWDLAGRNIRECPPRNFPFLGVWLRPQFTGTCSLGELRKFARTGYDLVVAGSRDQLFLNPSLENKVMYCWPLGLEAEAS